MRGRKVTGRRRTRSGLTLYQDGKNYSPDGFRLLERVEEVGNMSRISPAAFAVRRYVRKIRGINGAVTALQDYAADVGVQVKFLEPYKWCAKCTIDARERT